ncbi:hypothetical protein HEC60_03275 [Yokenella regensburgei]|nr:hypothetical protein HEC60_03275 [Yokenella regensburgei]
MAAASVLFVIASGKDGFDVISSGFASNGYGIHSPGGYSLVSAMVVEGVLTCCFLLVILGATDKNAVPGLAPVAIGLALTLIHLISIPVTNLKYFSSFLRIPIFIWVNVAALPISAISSLSGDGTCLIRE